MWPWLSVSLVFPNPGAHRAELCGSPHSAAGHCQLPAPLLASQCEVAAAAQSRGGSLGHLGEDGGIKPLSWSSSLCQEAMGTQVLWGSGPVTPLGWQLLALRSVRSPQAGAGPRALAWGLKECMFEGCRCLLWC